MLMLSLGERLRAWRKANRLTAEQVAALLGVSRVTIWHWERTERKANKPYREHIETLIARPFGMDQALDAQAEERDQVNSLRLHQEIRVSKERIAFLAGVNPADVEINISY
ncbi:helix-turn-helix transcriptional regulator [Novosphingobium sp. G106]|uniref:helix-turn-helix domain-containing protein n=1 Tax=Novosphingobium sp. G106 TaxID=2849500 RepID=UPI001C2D0C71|nr:helix-turn-helix transcriptional regulator [Novosphingobium sp. G106]MBV1688455.1 helix-turn-helix transcriptional regulator [Novosphingobium sp. G106]